MLADINFKDRAISKKLAQKIRKAAASLGSVKICHICGTHEWTITHFGIRSLLPPNVEVIAGPGCPVCIIPASEIDEAVELALKDVTITCFGDVIRVQSERFAEEQPRPILTRYPTAGTRVRDVNCPTIHVKD